MGDHVVDVISELTQIRFWAPLPINAFVVLCESKRPENENFSEQKYYLEAKNRDSKMEIKFFAKTGVIYRQKKHALSMVCRRFPLANTRPNSPDRTSTGAA